ncbi:MAG: hypothetical protein Fur0025_39900 [Oscillatoriaceae cyanobacterium]
MKEQVILSRLIMQKTHHINRINFFAKNFDFCIQNNRITLGKFNKLIEKG